jgi:hypothetical protein
MPVQRSAPEFEICIFPHFAMPQRGLKFPLGSYRVFHLIVWGLSAGRQWQCLAVLIAARGNRAIHDTTVYTVFTKQAADGSLGQAYIARVAHRELRSTSIPACSTATEPTPWAHRGRWRWIGGVQASDRGERYRDHRPSWLCRRTRPCCSHPSDRHDPIAACRSGSTP